MLAERRKEETKEMLLTKTTEAAALARVVEVGVEGALLVSGLAANRGHVCINLKSETALGGFFNVDPVGVGQTHETLGDVAAPHQHLVTQKVAPPNGSNKTGRDGTSAILCTGQGHAHAQRGDGVGPLVVRGDGGVVRGDGNARRDPVLHPARSQVHGGDGLVGRDETAAIPAGPLSDGGGPRARLRNPMEGRRTRSPMNGEEVDVGVAGVTTWTGVDQEDLANHRRI